MTSKQYSEQRDPLIAKLLEIRLIREKFPKGSSEYKATVPMQWETENKLTLLRNLYKNERLTNVKKVVNSTSLIRKIPDTYMGLRCTYCGGEMNDGLCTNSSPEWPHAPNDLLSNVQSTLSTEQMAV